jgi:hypothetical protein
MLDIFRAWADGKGQNGGIEKVSGFNGADGAGFRSLAIADGP